MCIHGSPGALLLMSELPMESMRELRAHLADVVDRAAKDEQNVITRRGRQVAAVVPIEMLRTYQEYEEQAIMRIVAERMENRAPSVPMEEVMVEFLENGE